MYERGIQRMLHISEDNFKDLSYEAGKNVRYDRTYIEEMDKSILIAILMTFP
jgi:hypothetical protein